MNLLRSLVAAAWVAAAVASPPALPQESKAPPLLAVKAARLFDGQSDALTQKLSDCLNAAVDLP